MKPASQRPGLWLAVLITVEAAALTTAALDGAADVTALITLYGVAFLAYAAAILLIRRRAPPLWIAVVIGLLLRAPWIPLSPSLSDDAWRYLHDGRAQAAGVNPYRYPPAAPEADAYAGPERPRVNHPHLRTIYPPAAQLTFLPAALLGGTIMAWKIVVLAFEALLAAAIVAILKQRRAPPGLLAVYLAHPLPVLEFAGNGHVDAVALGALVLALAWLGRRPAAAGAALAFSIAAKYLPLPVSAFAARQLDSGGRTRLLAGLGLGLAVLYAPYAGVIPLGSLGEFARTFEFNGSLYPLLAAILPAAAARACLAAGLAGLLGLLWIRRADAETAAFVWTAAVLFASPIVHPWYVTWLIPFLAWRRAPWALAWTGTVVLSYAVLPAWRRDEVWALPAWVPWVEYVPVILLLVWSWRHRRDVLRPRTG